MNIIYEDDYVIVCEKPAGVPSQSDRTSDYDMVNQLKNYRYEKEGKGNPYIGLVHRLDRPVGGVMVFGKTPYATKELNQQIQQHQMKKKYVAIVIKDLSSELTDGVKRLEHYLVKDGRTNLSQITTKQNPNGKKAILNYEVVEVKECLDEGILSLVDIELLTGRHHQIRVQLSQISDGIWGDTKYNKTFQNKKTWTNVALYSYSLTFLHPKTKKSVTFYQLPIAKPFSLFEQELAELITNK